MTQHQGPAQGLTDSLAGGPAEALPGKLAGELAEAVRQVPGVAFLRPGIAERLRSALPGSAGRSGYGAGLRVTRAEGGGGRRVEIRIVTLADARVLDVARAARAAADAFLAAALPAGPAPVTVRVTVTGVV